MRDHLGQSDPVEVLERHARNVGYDRPHDLVSAWRSGYADLIFDGFDEVANQGWISSAKRLSEIRFRSMEVLRRFVNETPGGAGLLFAGRTNYFDSEFELKTALNLKGRALVYRLLEFSTDEVKEFLNGLGWKKPIPDWMPTRPLLLGYLVAQELLEEIDPTSSLSPAAGWHALLDKISEREAQLEPGIQSGDIRRLLENVAVIARAREDGLGPVTASEIREAFVATCGLEPDDKATVLLGRLPGLGASQTEDGSRVFIDKDFANSAAGSALARFFQHPYDKDWKKKEWMQSLSPLGIEVALELFLDLGLSEGNVTSVEDELLSGGHYNMTLLADVVLFSGYSDYRIGHDVVVEGVFFPEISSTQFEGDLSRVTLDGGVVQFLELPERAGWSHLPKFQNCDIGKISGCTKKSELPNSKFDDECSVEKFDDSSRTTNETLKLDLPLGVKVAITILRKIYLQSGAGRRENALFRGLSDQAQSKCSGVLDVLEKYGFVIKTRQRGNSVYLPTKDRGVSHRARDIVERPYNAEDPVLVPLKRL